MTSLTGRTSATLEGTVKPPTIFMALAGACLQLSLVGYVWGRYSSFGLCVSEPLSKACLADPWARQVCATLCLALLLWVCSLNTLASTGSSDPSIVDRCWSILPIFYVWHLALSAPEAACQPRLLLMATLTTLWGGRLSWNFYVKGGFSGGEDYRWAEIRTWPGFKQGWELFNLVCARHAPTGRLRAPARAHTHRLHTPVPVALAHAVCTCPMPQLFICLFQQLCVLGFTSPAAIASEASSAPLNAIDAVAALLYLLLVAGEAAADKQMLAFQTEKYRRRAAGEPAGEYARGFIESGLWAYSRHPNYFCEVSLWWAFYLFSIAAGAPLINWSVLGPTFLTGLFVLPRASLDVTETLSSRKYAAYPEYQQRVSRFVPLPPRPVGELPPLTALDRVLIGWFLLGTAITYLIDIEQVVVADPLLYGRLGHTPRWPPTPCVHAIHWWGRTADPLVLARPTWFQAAIWLEVLIQAPVGCSGGSIQTSAGARTLHPTPLIPPPSSHPPHPTPLIPPPSLTVCPAA